MMNLIRGWSGNSLLVVILLAAPAGAAAQATIGATAPDFALKDQYESEFKLGSTRGEVILLVNSDRRGSQYSGNWSAPVREKYNASSTRVRIVGIADLEGVPGFMHGLVKRQFPGRTRDGKPIHAVLLDWQGVAAKLYGFTADNANVYLIDRTGVLRYRAAGKGEPQEIRLLEEAIDRLLTEGGERAAPHR